jgi:magnesium transporter
MFYIIEDNILREINVKEITNNTVTVGYLDMDELKENLSYLEINENILNDCMEEHTRFRNSIDIYDDFSFGILNVINAMSTSVAKDRIAFIVKKNQFFLVKLVDDDDSCKYLFDKAMGKYMHTATIEKIMFGILENLVLSGNHYLEIAEKRIFDMEQNLINGMNTKDLNKDIFELKKDLSSLMNYYEQLYNIGEELQGNQNQLFDDEDLRYFKIFTDKAKRLNHNIYGMNENLIHLREALDAVMNYNLNRIMKIFTVVTAVFMPLTFIVGWYGMNFTYMPEIHWIYGYPMVIVVSIIVIVVCLILFKRKKFV